MKRVLGSMAAAVAVLLSFMLIATVTSQVGAQAACAAAPKPKATINAQVRKAAGAAHLTRTQVGNVRTIVAIALKRKLPKRAAVIAVATSMQESRLRDLPYGDRDSLGLFQQRPSSGWGSGDQVVDPQYATKKFLAALAQVPNWRTLPLTKAAQAVQRSAFPNAYAHWEPLAKKLVSAMLHHPTPKAGSCSA
jgi:peptidoglycan DL-endopeptidase CwlO